MERPTMTNPPDETLVRVRIGETSDGRGSFETVWVEGLPTGNFRLVRAPVMALGLGVGDEFRLEGIVEVASRAGNLTVQVYSRSALGDRDLDELRAVGHKAGGFLDAHTKHVAAFTIPAGAGFPRVEEAFDAFVASRPDTEWAFANVYDEHGNPLNWW
jgi:hypothetical protein